MSHGLGERPSDWIADGGDPLRLPDDKRVAIARNGTVAALGQDLTSLRIQGLAGRGLIDPKSLNLREIQELSASIVTHIRQQHRAK